MRCLRLSLLFLLVFLLPPPAGAAASLKNQLEGHVSPYLALHARDPVAWQDWSPAPVERARRQGKLLYLSIGYFSCHWCHVMQRESFRNPEIAAFLNQHFIPVKIDRELEPALDARLIDFAEATRGRAGWPLNVFVTPEGHPLYAVLYLPPEDFFAVLKRLQAMWAGRRDELIALAKREQTKAAGPGRPELDTAMVWRHVDKLVVQALEQGDEFHGGFGDQNKFPSVPQLQALLAEQQRRPRPELKRFVQLTLEQMAQQGLYDHLGGGFFRYTVDPGWRTPHFEKMLYDNALLARLYLRAGEAFGRLDYTRVARHTLDFMARVMRRPDGGFVASLSAVDDKDVEGGYYLWHEEELARRLTPGEKRIYMLAWGMRDAPPFDEGYLPLQGLGVEEIAKELKLPLTRVKRELQSAEEKLRAARATRGLPVDTKQLAGWNGLALSAYAEAARLTGDQNYRAVADGLRRYLWKVHWRDGALLRSVSGGRAAGRASLEDYAYVAEGLLAWARLNGEAADYERARTVADQAWRRFHGGRAWRQAERSLIAPEPGEDLIYDGPMPSPSAVLMAVDLALAGHYKDKARRDRALAALNTGHALLAQNPFSHATHVSVMAAAVAADRGSSKSGQD